jgi:hypothetical protein
VKTPEGAGVDIPSGPDCSGAGGTGAEGNGSIEVHPLEIRMKMRVTAKITDQRLSIT